MLFIETEEEDEEEEEEEEELELELEPELELESGDEEVFGGTSLMPAISGTSGGITGDASDGAPEGGAAALLPPPPLVSSSNARRVGAAAAVAINANVTHAATAAEKKKLERRRAMGRDMVLQQKESGETRSEQPWRRKVNSSIRYELYFNVVILIYSSMTSTSTVSVIRTHSASNARRAVSRRIAAMRRAYHFRHSLHVRKAKIAFARRARIAWVQKHAGSSYGRRLETVRYSIVGKSLASRRRKMSRITARTISRIQPTRIV